MIALADVQSTVQSLLEAAAYFSGESVLEDLGAIEPDRNQALEGRGFCVTVLPLLRGTLRSQAQGKAVLQVLVLVLVEINPATNPAAANKDIYEACAAVVAAVLAYSQINPEDRFSLGPEPLEFSDHDPGLLSYIVTFTKLAVL